VTARVRADLRHDLAQLGGLTDDLADSVVLCASEAFANAVDHTRSGDPEGTVMRILSTPVVTACETTLRLSIIDDGVAESRPAIPAQRTSDEWAEAERGRGLLLIHHLAAEWGTARAYDFTTCTLMNTVTWAEFTYPTFRACG
jgi:anti-sigma regulatory factor (Ser/Thr protein kinase)